MQPNDNQPWSPEEASELSVDKKQELANTQASLPIIDDVLAWFDEQITTYSDPTIITKVSPSSDAEQVKKAVLFAQSMINDYKYKRKEFAKQFADYIETIRDD